MNYRFRPLALAAALFLIPALVSADARGPGSSEQRLELSRRLAAMLAAVQENHVRTDLESGDMVEGAIVGMLDTLDPHSNFLNNESYRTMREGQDGSFFGLGIIISVRRDGAGRQRLTVISPIDGMPAKKLGIRAGDIIAAIGGESTDELTLDGAVGKLRGAKGTSVSITIERGEEKFDLAIERAEIPTESIQHAYMIRPDVGFIRIKDFTKTTTRELHEAIGELRADGMKKLILDLRDNPGGLLDQAITVSSTFLDAEQLVVETRGRVQGSNEKSFTIVEGDRLPSAVPLIVLINKGSASASEIVSGAIQDHDRGLLVGGTTWGKGLVQSVYSLSSDTGLALTTARYYTPSGRQIQRDYQSSYFDYYSGPRKGAVPHGEGHVTDGGRAVFSGGGIQPDVTVEAMEWKPIVERMVVSSSFFNFANRVHGKAHAGKVKAGYRLTEQDLADYRAFLEREAFDVDEAEWKQALDQIRIQLLHEIANVHVDLQEGFKVLNEADLQVQAALGLWDRAERSAILRDARTTIPPALGQRVPEGQAEITR